MSKQGEGYGEVDETTVTEKSAPQVGLGNLMALAEEAEAQAARYREQAVALAREIEESRRPKMPSLGGDGDRAIVSFMKYQSGREYAYAAVGWRVGRSVRWAITGQTTTRMNWPALLDFIGEANWPTLHLMTESKLLGPLPGEEPAAVEHMGSFGRVLGVDLGRGVPGGGSVSVVAPFHVGGMLPGYPDPYGR